MGAFLAVVLAAAPMIAVPQLNGVRFEQSQTEFFSEHLAQELRTAGVRVVTNKEIATLLGMERQRQLLGCGEGSSCMTELANALGAEAMVLGGIARLDDGSIQVNVKLIREGGAALGSRSARVPNDADLTDALTAAAYELARVAFEQLRAKEPLPASVERDFRRAPMRPLSWIPAIFGAAGAAFGTVMLIQANQAHLELTQNPEVTLTTARAEQLALNGRTNQMLGIIGVGVGVLGITAAASMFFFRDAPVSLQASVGPGGGAFVVSGAFP